MSNLSNYLALMGNLASFSSLLFIGCIGGAANYLVKYFSGGIQCSFPQYLRGEFPRTLASSTAIIITAALGVLKSGVVNFNDPTVFGIMFGAGYLWDKMLNKAPNE